MRFLPANAGLFAIGYLILCPVADAREVKHCVRVFCDESNIAACKVRKENGHARFFPADFHEKFKYSFDLTLPAYTLGEDAFAEIYNYCNKHCQTDKQKRKFTISVQDATWPESLATKYSAEHTGDRRSYENPKCIDLEKK